MAVRYALVLLAVLIGALVVARRRFVVVRVHGVSMWPTYRPGDLVLIRRQAGRGLRRGQVVVFEPAQRGGWRTAPLSAPRDTAWTIKRIVALPGDPVPAEVAAALSTAGDETVPPGQLVVIGDGTDSADSRIWGYLPADRVLGIAVRRLTAGASSDGSTELIGRSTLPPS